MRCRRWRFDGEKLLGMIIRRSSPLRFNLVQKHPEQKRLRMFFFFNIPCSCAAVRFLLRGASDATRNAVPVHGNYSMVGKIYLVGIPS